MKTVKEFTEAMKSEEMQEAFNKYMEGKECDTAEKAEKLVREFALENGFELGEGEVSTMTPEALSDEELDNAAGGLLYSTYNPDKKEIHLKNPNDGICVLADNLGIVLKDDGLRIIRNPNENAIFARSDDGPDANIII